MYDPVVGRFLNADPVIQNAGFTQNYNRYSYCLNNPLKYVDPSGNQIAPRQYLDDGGQWERYGGSPGSGSSWMANFGEPGYAGWAGMFSDGVTRLITPHLDRARPLSNRQYQSSTKHQLNETYDVIYIGRVDRYAALSNSGDGWAFEVFNNGVDPINIASSSGGSNAMDLGNIGNYFIGIGATLGETRGSTYRLMKGGSFSPRLYSSGWLGGSRASIKTFSLAKTARGIGGATIVVGGVLDGVGVFSYYMNGPDHGLSVHPGKAGLNLGVGVYSFYLNPIAGGVYFGIDLLYPGGWGGYMNDTDRIIQRNQEILGPGWNMYRMEGGLK